MSRSRPLAGYYRFLSLRTFLVRLYLLWSALSIISSGLARPTSMNQEDSNSASGSAPNTDTATARTILSQLSYYTRSPNVNDNGDPNSSLTVANNDNEHGYHGNQNGYHGNHHKTNNLDDNNKTNARLDELLRGTEAIQEFQKLLNEQMLNSAAVGDILSTPNNNNNNINNNNNYELGKNRNMPGDEGSPPSSFRVGSATPTNSDDHFEPQVSSSKATNFRHNGKNTRHKTTHSSSYNSHHYHSRHKIDSSTDLAADSLSAVIDSDNRRFYSAPNNFVSSPYECPKVNGKVTQLLCPSRRRHGYHVCIDETALCNGIKECPNAEDENPVNCMFYKTTMRYFKTVVDQVVELSEHILEQSRRRSSMANDEL